MESQIIKTITLLLSQVSKQKTSSYTHLHMNTVKGKGNNPQPKSNKKRE